MSSLKKEIIKDVTIFSGGNFAGKIILVFRGIITAKFLGPSMYGLWNALSIILTYSGQAHLGTLSALQKELPYYYAKGENDRAKAISNVVLSFEIITGVIIGLLLFITSFFLQASFALIVGLRVVAVLVLFQLIEYFYYTLLRSEKKFTVLSRLTILYSFTMVALIVPMVIFYGIYGLFTALLIMPLISIFFYTKHTDYCFKFVFNFSEIKRLIKIGYPIVSMILLYSLFRSIDKIMIVGFLGKVNLGYYSIAVMVNNFLFLAPSSIADSISPRMFGKLGEMDNTQGLNVYLIKPTITQAYFISVLTGLAVIAAEFVIKAFLIEYMVSFPLVIILCFGSFFVSIPLLTWSYLVALNKQRNMLPLFGLSILLSITLNYIFIKLGMGITGIAIGTAIASFFYGTSLLGYCALFCFKGIKQRAIFFLKVYSPLFYMLAVVLLINRIFSLYSLLLDNALLCALSKTIILMLFSSPLFFYINKTMGVLTLFCALFKRKTHAG
ncbi:MAG: hypothetical protein DRP78_05495 [Candidatus Omnitrophota bacterium]|nr:MAG: hypothetical protein DRP78_05495 [Candidatus Omnitrophota bacterium]